MGAHAILSRKEASSAQMETQNILGSWMRMHNSTKWAMAFQYAGNLYKKSGFIKWQWHINIVFPNADWAF